MLDPLTTFSLEFSVVQFIEFGCNFYSMTRDICHAGSSEGNLDLRMVTSDLISVSMRLRTTISIPAAMDATQLTMRHY
jgi:hypothetical protein